MSIMNLAKEHTLDPEPDNLDHAKGNGTITLVEYGDYQCDHCLAAFYEVEKLFEDPSLDFTFVFRHFPMRNQHPMSQLAAETAEAAGSQGKYWQMHELLFKNQKDFSYGEETILAHELNLDMAAFENDIKTHRFADKVQEDFESGIHSGVNGTPTFFINGFRYNGEKSFQVIKETLLQL